MRLARGSFPRTRRFARLRRHGAWWTQGISTSAVFERKVFLDGRADEWQCRALSLIPGTSAALRYIIEEPAEVGSQPLVLAPGDISIAHHWSERPYNVYHWHHDGMSIGIYCNVAESLQISKTHVVYRDLVVDVLFLPDGTVEVLDEDEVPSDLSESDRRHIEWALEQLMRSPKMFVKAIESATASAVGAARR